MSKVSSLIALKLNVRPNYDTTWCLSDWTFFLSCILCIINQTDCTSCCSVVRPGNHLAARASFAALPFLQMDPCYFPRVLLLLLPSFLVVEEPLAYLPLHWTSYSGCLLATEAVRVLLSPRQVGRWPVAESCHHQAVVATSSCSTSYSSYFASFASAACSAAHHLHSCSSAASATRASSSAATSSASTVGSEADPSVMVSTAMEPHSVATL